MLRAPGFTFVFLSLADHWHGSAGGGAQARATPAGALAATVWLSRVSGGAAQAQRSRARRCSGCAGKPLCGLGPGVAAQRWRYLL